MVSIKIIQGRGEIGGNCIRLEDRDRFLVLDQGLRFSVMKRYYTHRIEPMGIPELREIGAIPPLRAYDKAEAVYITHFHLDHLGLLYAVPDITVKVPSLELFKLIEKWHRASSSWLKYVAPNYRTPFKEVRPLCSDENDVLAIPVYHSAYPSYAYVYFGSDETVLYTGDLRLTPLADAEVKQRIYNNTTLIEYLRDQKDLKIDNLIIEGTNIGRAVTPLSGSTFKAVLSELLSPDKLSIIILNHHELELMATVYMELQRLRKTAVLASSRVVETLSLWRKLLNLEFDNAVALANVIEGPTDFDLISEGDVSAEPHKYGLIADVWHVIDFLRLLEPGGVPVGSEAVMLSSEPEEEESHDEEAALRWLRHYGVQPYRLRVSGHYYLHELKEILQSIKPKEVTPVHTEHPYMIAALHERLKN